MAAHPEHTKPFWLWLLVSQRRDGGGRYTLGDTRTKFMLTHHRLRQGRWA